MAKEIKIGVGLDISKIESQAQDIGKVLQKIQLDPAQKKSFDTMLDKFGKDLKTYQDMFAKGFKTKADVNQFDKLGNVLVKQAGEIQKEYNKIVNLPVVDLEKKIKLDGTVKKQVDDLNKSIKEALTTEYDNKGLSKLIADLDPSKFKGEGVKKKVEEVYNAFNSGKIDEARQKLNKFYQQYQNLNAKNWGANTEGGQAFQAFEHLKQALDGLSSTDLTSLTNLQTQVEGLNAEKVKLIADYIQNVVNSSSQLASQDLKKPMEDLANGAKSTAEGMQQTSSEIERLGDRVKYFFSLTNGVMLFRRAIRSAISTVKDLDKVMTETAVVTNFSVGDMWSQLPEYTERANALGVSIHDAYEAATLYYQQGLKTNQVMAISNSTLKMARIASLSAEDATSRMTNALRGFNMEINETNADRVADVYSKLAAITASNVDEISKAMTKVASLANNANMEFENTAAFLAQIIETTRESAETAGTALKTVIARFSEVKKLYSEGDLIGKDEEGESIDVNKVSVALRSAGIDLNEYLTGMKGLDQIFIELANKWDSLDQVQQRYIATMAAGSRQQSRFIALMSDYQRTQELTSAATNASGASQAQFEKTLDSLQSKLAQLKNAWNTFLMGLSNNEVIKIVVDILTKLVTILNNITGIMPGVLGSFSKLLVTFLGLKLGKDLFAGLKAGFATMGKESAETFSGAFKREFSHQSKGFRAIFHKAFWVGEKEIKKSVTIPKEAAVSVDRYTAATQRYNTAKARENSITAAGLAGSKSEAQLKTIINARDKERTEIISQYAQARSINEAAAEAELATASNLTAIQDLQLTNDQALLVAQSGLNESSASRISLALSEVGITGEKNAEITKEILLKAAENRLTEEGNMHLTLEEALQKKGLLGKIALIGYRKLNKDALQKEAGAQHTLNGSIAIGIGLMLLYAAAIAAVIAIAVLLYKAIKNNSYTEQLKRATEATQHAQAAAEEAKTAYDDLLSKHDEYNDLQEELAGLTKGTDEWREKLFEVNNQVLELIRTYPQLSRYLASGEQGQLIITEEGWNKAIADQKKAVGRANMGALKARSYQVQLTLNEQEHELIKQIDKTTEEDYNQNREKFGRHTSGNSTILYQKEGFDELLANIYNADFWDTEFVDGAEDYDDNLDRLAEALGLTSEELYNTHDALIDYANALNEAEIQLQAEAKATAMSLVDETNDQYQYLDEVTSGFGRYLSGDTFGKEVDQYVTKLDEGSDYDDNEEFQKIANNYGVTLNHSEGSDRENLEKVYAAVQGLRYEDVKDKDLTEKEMLRAIATGTKTDKLTDELNNFIKQLQTLNQSSQKTVAALMSRNSSQLRGSDINNLSKLNLNQIAAQAGYSKGEFLRLAGYENTEFSKLSGELQKKLEGEFTADSIVTAEAIFKVEQEIIQEGFETTKNQVIDTLNKYNASDLESRLDQMTAAQMTGMENQLKDVANRGGNASEIASLYNALADAVPPDLFDSMMTQLNGVDWESSAAVETALTQMAETIERADQVITKDSIEKLKEAGNSIREYSEANMVAAQKANKEAVNTVEEHIKEGNRKYTEEEYSNLILQGANKEDFQRIGEDYYFLGEEGTLLNDIEDHTAKILQEMLKEDQKSAERGRDWEEKANYKDNKVTLPKKIIASEIDPLLEYKYFVAAGKSIPEEYYNTNVTDYGYKNLGDFEAQAKEEYSQFLKDNNIQSLNEFKKYFYSDSNESADITYESLDDFARAAAGGNLDLDKNTEQWMRDVLTDLGVEIASDLSGADLQKKFGETYIEDQQAFNRLNFKDDKIANDVFSNGMSNAAAEAATYAEDEENRESAIKGLQSLAIEYGATKDQIDAMSDSLQTQGIDEKQSKLYAAALAAELNKQGKAFQNVGERIGEYATDLKTATKNSDKYTAAISGIRNALKAAFRDNFEGLELTDEFIEANADLFATWSEGGEDADEAMNTLLKKMQLSLLNATDLKTEIRSGLLESLEDINGLDIEIGAYLTENQIPDFFKNLEADSKETMDQINAFMQTQGWMLTWKEVTDENGNVSYSIGTVQRYNPGSYFTSGNIGGSGKSGSDNRYEPDYDILYNLIADLEEIQKAEERLVEELDELKENPNATPEQITAKLTELIDLYRKNYELENQKLEARRAQAQRIMADNADLQQYASINTKTGTVHIDYQAIDALKNVISADEGKRIDEYIDQLEEMGDDIVEGVDNLEEIEDKVEDLKDYGRDDYLELEQRVMDSVVKLYEDQIEGLEKVNEAINEANQQLLDGIRESIDQQRQARENEKTEEEIANTAAKLAYLQMDTSGSNQVDILNLQKQLDDQRQSYTDSLIDQKINELEEQNKVAQEQREQQIQIAQDQLTNAQETGKLWSDVSTLMNKTDGPLSKNTQNAMSAAGITDMASLLKNGDGWIAKSEEQRRDWEKEYKTQFANASVYASGGVNEKVKSVESYFDELQKGSGMPNTYLAAIADKKWQIQVNVSGGGPGYVEKESPDLTPESITNNSYSNILKQINDWYTKEKQKIEEKRTDAIFEANQKGGSNLQAGINQINKVYDQELTKLEEELRRKKAAAAEKGKASGMGIQLQAYKTGGIADFTGPAWLDGTKTRPELVLNQRDTENFLRLRSILEQIMGGQHTNIANPGLEHTLDVLTGETHETNDQLDNIYEMLRALRNAQTNVNFDIDIDSIDDEDKINALIERIKQELVDSAMYRNVNVLNQIY